MTITLSLPRGKLKAEILDLAFDDCGMAGYEFERTPEEQSNALRKLNAMMLEQPWAQLGYRQPTYGAGLPEESSGIPDFAFNTVAQYLALRIAPGMGASLAPEQAKTLSRSLLTMQAELATPPTTSLPGNTVRGSGRGAFGGFRRWPYTGAR
jgi:hypothetical protein